MYLTSEEDRRTRQEHSNSGVKQQRAQWQGQQFGTWDVVIRMRGKSQAGEELWMFPSTQQQRWAQVAGFVGTEGSRELKVQRPGAAAGGRIGADRMCRNNVGWIGGGDTGTGIVSRLEKLRATVEEYRVG